jgi:hypothetical protein
VGLRLMTSFNFGFLPTMLIMPAVENPRQITRPLLYLRMDAALLNE